MSVDVVPEKKSDRCAKKNTRNMKKWGSTRPKNNKDRRRKTPAKRHRKYIQQNHRRKHSQPKE